MKMEYDLLTHIVFLCAFNVAVIYVLSTMVNKRSIDLHRYKCDRRSCSVLYAYVSF